jgi:acyl-CoA synthetase (AMP-forming)/AMP-acid ligase II
LGARIHAIVDTPGRLSDEELLTHLAERLVHYKIPENFEYIDEPLRGVDGKVRCSALRTARIGSE